MMVQSIDLKAQLSRLSPKVCFPAHQNVRLGEGALIDPQNGHLYTIDIEDGRLNIHALSEPSRGKSFLLKSMIGTVALTDCGQPLVALQRGIFLLDPKTGETRLVNHPEQENENLGMRYNDGRPGPDGKLYVGSMLATPALREQRPGSGKLWQISGSGEAKVVLSGLDIPNGMAWIMRENGKSAHFFHIDSPTQAIKQYRHDLQTGSMEMQRIVYKFSGSEYPDGMALVQAVNSEKYYLAVALYNGSAVAFCDWEGGREIGRISFPVPQMTSVAVEPGGSTLFATSAAEHYGPEDFKRYPTAGDVYSVDLKAAGLRGVAPYKFKVQDANQ